MSIEWEDLVRSSLSVQRESLLPHLEQAGEEEGMPNDRLQTGEWLPRSRTAELLGPNHVPDGNATSAEDTGHNADRRSRHWTRIPLTTT